MAIHLRRTVVSCLLAPLLFGALALTAQQPDPAFIIQHIDATVKARIDSIAGYTATEHYAVYRKESGKSYTIVSHSGSDLIQHFVLNALLENEKQINLPANREGSWLTSANYEMKLKPGGVQRVNGRDCLLLAISPRRKAPYLLEGTVWVDARDYSLVQIQGSASKSPSMFSGATLMMRQYANVQGFAEATHARAVSSSFMFGQTVITIDYSNYSIELVPSK